MFQDVISITIYLAKKKKLEEEIVFYLKAKEKNRREVEEMAGGGNSSTCGSGQWVLQQSGGGRWSAHEKDFERMFEYVKVELRRELEFKQDWIWELEDEMFQKLKRIMRI